jgi:Glycosyl transferase family 21
MGIPLILAILDHLAKTLLHWNQAVCQSKWIIYLEFHGMVPGFLLGTLWFLSGWVRSKKIYRINNKTRRGSSLRTSSSSPPPPEPPQERRRRSLRSYNSNNILNTKQEESSYPSVAIILPTRGYRPHSLQNWQAILNLDYPLKNSTSSTTTLLDRSRLEFIFVVEDKHDPAHSIIQNIIKSTCTNANRSARIVYSGLASKSSQKIHNLIAGISSATTTENTLLQPKYILCLDDDVHVHPTALSSLIRDMEASPDLRIATGYPFDIPAEHAGILSYAALAYHLPLVIGFSLNEKTHFVWGGCMLFRAQDVRPEDDLLGFLSGWTDGGYSDDLTVAARCTELGLQVLCPSYAIFPQYLDANYSIKRYWNYLRRQLVVLDTYASDHNRCTNHVMAVLHCYFSWAFVVPVGSCIVKVGIWGGMIIIKALVSLLIVSGAVAASNVNGGGNRELQKEFPSLFRVSTNFLENNDTHFRKLSYISAICFIACSLYAAISLRWMTSVVCTVMGKNNPEALSSKILIKRFNWVKLWVGFITANAVLPICMVYTFMTRHITWAGVKYRRRSGKIISVEHP